MEMESLGESAVMEAAGSENPRDPAAMAEMVLSLSSETMVVPATVASADGATLLLTVAMLSSLW